MSSDTNIFLKAEPEMAAHFRRAAQNTTEIRSQKAFYFAIQKLEKIKHLCQQNYMMKEGGRVAVTPGGIVLNVDKMRGVMKKELSEIENLFKTSEEKQVFKEVCNIFVRKQKGPY